MPEPTSSPDAADAELMAAISEQLVVAIEAAVGPWIQAAVAAVVAERAADLAPAVAVAGRTGATELGTRLRSLLALDIDAQTTTPLAIVRSAAKYPADVLEAAGVIPPDRDPFDQRANPDDRYDVGPSTWADLGPEVGELGIAWGAAKAHLHLRRHRS